MCEDEGEIGECVSEDDPEDLSHMLDDDPETLFACDSEEKKVDEDPNDPALLEVVRQMLKGLDSQSFAQLCDNWKLLSEMSVSKPLGSGSGCTGSGLDWYTIKVCSEVPCLLFI